MADFAGIVFTTNPTSYARTPIAGFQRLPPYLQQHARRDEAIFWGWTPPPSGGRKKNDAPGVYCGCCWKYTCMYCLDFYITPAII